MNEDLGLVSLIILVVSIIGIIIISVKTKVVPKL